LSKDYEDHRHNLADKESDMTRPDKEYYEASPVARRRSIVAFCNAVEKKLNRLPEPGKIDY
jgi:hypothetical protein